MHSVSINIFRNTSSLSVLGEVDTYINIYVGFHIDGIGSPGQVHCFYLDMPLLLVLLWEVITFLRSDTASIRIKTFYKGPP